MSWKLINNCNTDPSDSSSASDADIDIAFSLLMADAQWGNNGEINYHTEAVNLINTIYNEEVNREIHTIMLGNWLNIGDNEYDDMRSSDFIPVAFKAFYKVTDNTGWPMLIEKGYDIFRILQQKYSRTTGLIPDFIQDCRKRPHPAKPRFLESNYDGCYYYNACRVPWRIASDYLFNAEPKAKVITEKMTNWLIKHTDADTGQIRAGYYLNGKNITGNDYYCPAFIGPFAIAAMTSAKYQKWLNDLWDCLVAIDLNENRYYDNTIKMLCLIVLSGNYWSL